MANSIYFQNSLSFLQQTNAYHDSAALRTTSLVKEQVLAESSITDLIHTALHDISSEAIAETQEEMSLVMGGKVRDAQRRGRDLGKSIDQRRNLAVLNKYVTALGGAEIVALEKLVSQFSDAMDRHDLISYFQQHELDSGQMALILSALLSRSNLSSSQRKKLRDALYQVMEEGTWSLSMFVNLSLQEVKPQTFQQLKSIYQHAQTTGLSLVQWFQKFQEMEDRQQKIKLLIRALGFELSMQRPSLRDEHLGAVISDLQRVLLFLGISDHCEHVARILPWAKLTGDEVLAEILTVMEQIWIGADWLRSRYEQHGFSCSQQYLLAHQLIELIKLLAEPCFRDTEQREMLCTAYADYLSALATEENI